MKEENGIKRLESVKDLENLKVGDKINGELGEKRTNWQLTFIRKESVGFGPKGYYEFRGIGNDGNSVIEYSCFPHEIKIINGKVVQEYLISYTHFATASKGMKNYDIIKKEIEEISRW